jgi:hypothetical protein
VDSLRHTSADGKHVLELTMDTKGVEHDPAES